jgi:dihydrofolate reductase
MIVSAVAAIGNDGVMGREGELPWTLPADLKRFRAVTWGKPIIMGRKTHESLGRALPGRTNIVLTRQADYRAIDCLVAHSADEALALAQARGAEEVVVIGGSGVFEALIPRCEKVYLTLVEGEFEGDTFFPVGMLASSDWDLVHQEFWPADARNRYPARYQILERRCLVENMDESGLVTPEVIINAFSDALFRGIGAFFIGSGISRESRVPTWTNLLEPLARTRLEIGVSDRDDLPELAQFVLNRCGGNRGTLVHGFIESLRHEFRPNPLHEALARSNVSTIWTTNYDNLIEKAFFQEEVEVKASDDSISRSVPGYRAEIIKMHGCISRSPHEDLVITQEDYEDYGQNRPATVQRLRSDLLHKSFLFVGYSYRDPNVRNIFVEARRLSRRATRTHYIILKKADHADREARRRQVLWCQNLTRLGIESALISEHSELRDILSKIAIKSRGRTVFVTGSHTRKQRSLFRDLGRILAQEGGGDRSKHIVLIDGQSTGVNHHVVAAFNEAMVTGKKEIEGRIRVFPNPYAANPAFSNDPSLLPMLKRWRAPLLRSTQVVVVFDGGMGTKTEVELAQDLGCRVVPVALDRGGLAHSLLFDADGKHSQIAHSLEPSYRDKALTGSLDAGDIMECIRTILDE